MPSNRIGRINEEIQRELADQLRRLKDPRVSQVGMVSITRVDTTSDLRYAPGLYQCSGQGPGERRAEGPEIRRRLPAAGAGTGPAAAIHAGAAVHADDSIQHGAHILEILRQVERQDEARDDPDAGETEE